MNKCFNQIRKSYLLQAVLGNLLIMILLTLFLLPQYKNTADLFMQSLISGIAGVRVSHLLFSNVILGKIYTILSKVLPMISWYSVIQFAASYAAITVITAFLLKKNPSVTGRVTALLMTLCLGLECYVFPGYVKTASVLVIAGLLFLAMAAEEKKKLLLLPGIVFMTGASLFSFKVFTIVFFFGSLLLLLYVLISQETFPGKEKKMALFLLIVSLALTTVCSAGGFLMDRRTYRSEKWKDAWKYRNVYERIYTFGVNTEKKSEMEIAEKKFENLMSGYGVGMTSKSYDKLKKQVLGTRKISVKTILAFTRAVPLKMFEQFIFYPLLLLGMVIGYEKKKKAVQPLIIAWIGHWIILYVMYLYFNQFFFVGLMPVLFWVLLHSRGLEMKMEKQYLAYLAILGIILFQRFQGDFTTKMQQGDLVKEIQYSKMAAEASAKEEACPLLLLTQVTKGYSIFMGCNENITKEANLVPEAIYGLIPELKSLNKNPYGENFSKNTGKMSYLVNKGPKVTEIYVE